MNLAAIAFQFDYVPESPGMQAVQALLMAFFWITMGLLPWVALTYGLYFLISLPMRRKERARFILHLIEVSGHRNPENVITSISESRDASVGARFHLLAEHVKSGLRLGDALLKVPRLLPPPITAMLRVGEAIGDVRKVLPACRKLVTDGPSQVRSAQSYACILILFVLPVVPFLTFSMRIFVIPKFKEMAAGFLGEGAPPLNFGFLDALSWISILPMVISLALVLWAIIYVGGPQFVKWADAGIFPFGDWIVCRLPWCRTRMKRDFSAMLGLLLDANVPESTAVEMAADSTANRVFISRARIVASDLAAGVKLADALARLDGAREFKWRLDNASHGSGGFSAALAGWIEALDARAFKQEETAAQLLTTAVVLLNGLIVGVFVIAVFGCLIHFLNVGLLW